MLEQSDTILVSHRRMFQNDESRYFLGRTIASEGDLIKVEGFTFFPDFTSGHVIKKNEKRIKIDSLASPSLIVYQLPQGTDIDNVSMVSESGEAVLVDGDRTLMNLTERTRCGQF